MWQSNDGDWVDKAIAFKQGPLKGAGFSGRVFKGARSHKQSFVRWDFEVVSPLVPAFLSVRISTVHGRTSPAFSGLFDVSALTQESFPCSSTSPRFLCQRGLLFSKQLREPLRQLGRKY